MHDNIYDFCILCIFIMAFKGKDITEEILKSAETPQKCITIQPQIFFEYDVNYTTPVRYITIVLPGKQFQTNLRVIVGGVRSVMMH